MSSAVRLIRNQQLAQAVDYAYAATADALVRSVWVAGACPLDVASTRRPDLVTTWNVYREYMGGHDVPSTLLGVTVLGYDDQLVEVEAVAVLPAR